MKIEIHIRKEHFCLLAVLLTAVLFVVGVNAAVNTGKTVGHDASEVVPGMFGGTGDYGFPNNLFFPNNLAGIYWTSLGNGINTKPHIGYSSGWGLIISSGAGSTYPVRTEGAGLSIENGNLTFANNPAKITISASNILVPSPNNITLGGVSRNTWPEVPSKFCVFSYDQTAICPAGWSSHLFDTTRALAGAASYAEVGQIGGTATHKHTFTLPEKPVAVGSGEHPAHKGDYTTNSASSWPPYVKVLVCCKI